MFSIKQEYTRMDNLVNTRMDENLHDVYSSAYISRMNIGDRLDQAMKTAGYKTQQALAVAAGIPQPTVNRILKGGGKRGPETETLKKLAAACGVSFLWLSGEQPAEPMEQVEKKVVEVVQPKIRLVYVTDEEMDILQSYREAPEMQQKLIYTAATKLPKDRKKLEGILKPAS